MRIAFIANTHGELGQLEAALLNLRAHKVDRIVPVELAVQDVAAVLRERAARFPEPVAPSDLGFADFVLAAVLQDQVEPNEIEVNHTRFIQDRLVQDGEAERGMRVEERLVVVRSVQTPVEGADLLVLAPHERFKINAEKTPPRLCPGHMRREIHEGEGPGLALVDVTPERIEIRRLTLDGVLGEATIL